MKGLPGSINVFISRLTSRMCSIKGTSLAVKNREDNNYQPSLGDGQMKKWEDPDRVRIPKVREIPHRSFLA